jgi:uncharacterized protein
MKNDHARCGQGLVKGGRSYAPSQGFIYVPELPASHGGHQSVLAGCENERFSERDLLRNCIRRARTRRHAVTASSSIYFVLVFALSLPFYLLGAAGLRLPGLPMLPFSALMAWVPMVAALFLIFRERGAQGAMALLKSAFDIRKVPSINWYLTALLFRPAISVLEFGALRLSGNTVPSPQIAPGAALFLFLVFFIGAIGEEAGWQGYAYPALRDRLSVLGSAVALGTIWALWHVIPYTQMGRSTEWIIWQCLSTIALRIIIVWLFENTGGSVFIAVLVHTMINVSWALFPNSGSYYDPFVAFVILLLAVGLIVFLWGAATLATFRVRPMGGPS